RGGVLAQYAKSGTFSDRATRVVSDVVEHLENVVTRFRDHDLFAGGEEVVESIPPIADDRHAARRRFEQTHTRRPAGANHLRARDVQRPSLRVVELAMSARREMNDALHVARPAKFFRILRTGDDESSIRPLPRRFEQQSIERRLAIVAVRAEVSEVPAKFAIFGVVMRRI